MKFTIFKGNSYLFFMSSLCSSLPLFKPEWCRIKIEIFSFSLSNTTIARLPEKLARGFHTLNQFKELMHSETICDSLFSYNPQFYNLLNQFCDCQNFKMPTAKFFRMNAVDERRVRVFFVFC